MDSIFGPQGLLAKHHKQFEYRPGQVEMAEAVYDVLQKGGHLCVEAGTGTGKTLAYLIPALALKKRVIISTATKSLQEQLFQKDVPFLEKALGRQLRVAYLKGRGNYLCLHRLNQSDAALTFAGMEDVTYFNTVRKWAKVTQTGDRAELVDLPEDLAFWHDIDARSEICLGSKCSKYDDCFITLARQRAEDSDIIIVNHHLFFADLAARNNDYGAILPDYTMVIFDEAHEIEDIAAEYFGTQVSNYRLTELIQDIQKVVIPDAELATETLRWSARVGEQGERFWSGFFRYGNTIGDGRFNLETTHFAKRNADGKFEITPAGEQYVTLDNGLNTLREVLKKISEPPPEIERLVRRLDALRLDLDFLVTSNDGSFVYWFERRGRGCFLQATPINLSEILADRLFAEMESVVLTSATLTSGGKFDFIKARLGLAECEEVIVDSHFDYRKQAVLYLPRTMPDPRTPQFTKAAIEEIVKILNLTHGRAFVLSTSAQHMRELFDGVSAQVDFPCFLQGRGSKAGLLEKFRTTKGAVLFATASFWQGIDVQGEALSCVIVDKLPFPVPTDPVVAARHRFLEEQGHNPFMEYTVPQAIITLKQGLGRLIRSSQDRGVLAILDPRLRTKFYGKVFLDSLPPAPIVYRLEDVSRLFPAQPAK
ncbi:MAG: DEAD/DEAH box helicase [Blastocatellia bacterium]|nr:DEAD/DEAH box helicase [Blastocatellia bacterium]